MFSQSQTLMMGFSQSQAEGSPAKKTAKTEDRQTCLPVSIRSMESAVSESGSDGIQIFGVEHGMLVLVALVESLTKQNASMDMSLNDGTGRIKARYYNTEKPPKGIEDITTGRYINAFGNIRTAPTPHFVITGMRVVETADEISYHMIESAHAALKLQRGMNEPKEPATPSPKKMSMPCDTPVPEHHTSAPAPELAVTKPLVANSALNLRDTILTSLRKDADSHPEGSALDSLIAHSKPASAEEVRKELERLVDDGEIFTTVDDEHFSCV